MVHIETVAEAIQWLRDVSELDSDPTRAEHYREAARDLAERHHPKASAAELAARYGFKPHGRPPGA